MTGLLTTYSLKHSFVRVTAMKAVCEKKAAAAQATTHTPHDVM